METAEMETTGVKETRTLKMHTELLLTNINRQAGDLQKAILEGVMNGLEANADYVKINFSENGAMGGKPGSKLTIVDNGHGISSVQEIYNFFEMFGTPHSENENMIWKQFRMGRGQLFSYGKNIWRTSTFKMVVDIKERGLDYDLWSGLPHVDGCTIEVELYKNPIGSTHNSLDVLKASVKKQVQFIEGLIYFDGERINTPASECKWDCEDDDAYYLFNAGINFEIYNLGAYVTYYSPTTFGMPGVVVSKKQLKVNFARNAIQGDCEIWQRAQEVVRENRIKKTYNPRRRLNVHEKTATMTGMRDGMETYNDCKNLGLLTTTSDKTLSLAAVKRIGCYWTFAEKGNRLADKMMQEGLAICFDEDVLTDLEFSSHPSEFFTWLVQRSGLDRTSIQRQNWRTLESLYVPFDKLSSNFDHKSGRMIPTDKQTVVEKRVISILNNFGCWEGRRICIGIGNFDAWTDGNSYITLNRDYLKRLRLASPSGAASLIFTMLHELAHDEDTSKETHCHGYEFYSRFHDISRQHEGNFGYGSPFMLVATFASKLNQSRILKRYEDRMERDRKAEEKKKAKLGID